MSIAIRPNTPSAATTEAGEAPDPKKAALHKAAEEFESIFLRQILSAAKLAGKDSQSGYGSMAVDALASGIQAGGGFGLTRQIELALAQHDGSARPIAPLAGASPAVQPQEVAGKTASPAPAAAEVSPKAVR